MSNTIELVPLLCSRCQAAVPANPDEVAWVCAQCGQGLLLDEEKGTVPLTINFDASIPVNQSGWPFWVADGKVNLDQRKIFGLGDQSSQAVEYWKAPRRFYIPAFNSPLDQLIGWGTSLLQNPPVLQSGQAATFTPVILSPHDIQPAAEFIVLGIEAARKDKLREIHFNVQLSTPQLWILNLSK
jgi:hypothetical protein